MCDSITGLTESTREKERSTIYSIMFIEITIASEVHKEFKDWCSKQKKKAHIEGCFDEARVEGGDQPAGQLGQEEHQEDVTRGHRYTGHQPHPAHIITGLRGATSRRASSARKSTRRM
jgi:hypothetical protein